MAWPFQIAIECGEDALAANRVKAHFDGIPCALEDGTPAKFFVDSNSQDEDKRWWVSSLVFIGNKGLQFGDDPSLLAKAGKELYERLKSAPAYRFAVVGIDCFQFNGLEALPRLIRGPIPPGLVVSEELFQNLGKPKEFVGFSPGYLWLPSDYKYGG